jgi:hypothetical protein
MALEVKANVTGCRKFMGRYKELKIIYNYIKDK